MALLGKCSNQNSIADWAMRTRDAPYMANRKSSMASTVGKVSRPKAMLYKVLSRTVLAFYIS